MEAQDKKRESISDERALQQSATPSAQERIEPKRASTSDETQQLKLNTQEWQARVESFAMNNAGPMLLERKVLPAPLQTMEVRVGLLRPIWLGEELLLVRRVRVDRTELVQGAWLQWPEVRTWLLASVRDLFPDARLVPASDSESDQGRRLAALPVRLEPGRPVLAPAPTDSTLRLPLLVAWAFAALAVAAVGSLLWGMATLGERRAAFVSAVTHELRTPLTTFRMYTDMLAEGMVRDDAQRREYLTTLQREAERQSHLVENVLAYSRLERGRYTNARAALTVDELLSETLPPMAAHAERAGLQLVVSADPVSRAARVSVDRGAVERILFNLVDNACKHALQATDRTLTLECRLEGSSVRLLLSDHGPGVPSAIRRRLFRPFHRSAADAAGSAPGVGLGLALSRRLARAMGGDLRLTENTDPGARFCLDLPTVPSTNAC